MAFLVLPLRLRFHRRAAGVGLHAAPAPAGALGPAALDDDVADLAGGAAAQPRFAVEHEAAADAGAPEDPDQALELAPGAEVELGLGRDLDVVADPDLGAEGFPQALRERKASLPARQVAGVGDDAGLLVDVARRADADPLQGRGLDPRLFGRLAQRRRHLVGHVLRSAAGGRRPPRLARDSAGGVDDRRLDLRPAQVYPTAQLSHAGSLRWADEREPGAAGLAGLVEEAALV